MLARLKRGESMIKSKYAPIRLHEHRAEAEKVNNVSLPVLLSH